jgi:plastocyanin
VNRRRTLLGLGAAATASLLLAAPAVPAISGKEAAGAADPSGCVRHRHTKRIVHHVRRHGKRRRIVRFKHWWTCDAPPASGPARLSVKAFEYGYLLSRQSVVSGDIIVEFENQGEDAHNLNIAPTDSTDPPIVTYGDTPSLERVSQRFSLAPGSYRLWCDLPEHESRGMHATLIVDSP